MLKNLISVVDDDASVLRTTTLLIESFGLRAAGFESADAFLKSDLLHETSCLIVDVRMPGMSGTTTSKPSRNNELQNPNHFCHSLRR